MTNYFGKARLIKLFYHYISDRTEFLKSFKAYVNEFGKEIMFLYKKYRGSEWLEIHHDGYYFKFYVFGQASKTIDFKEYRIDLETDGDGGELTTKTCIVRIISYYTADFTHSLIIKIRHWIAIQFRKSTESLMQLILLEKTVTLFFLTLKQQDLILKQMRFYRYRL